MTAPSTTSISIADGLLTGPIRRSVNNSRDAKGSIHDDATASKLGFRGGTVAGSIHNDLFAPLIVGAFGQSWWERGSLSMYYMNATTDREAVRASMKQPTATTNAQVEAWVQREDGMQVAQGTIAAGNPGVPTALLSRPLDRFEPGELRLLRGVEAGRRFEPVQVSITSEQQAVRMRLTTEPLDWFVSESPWGKPVAMLAPMVQLLYAKSVATLRGGIGRAVGLFGAIELRNINGPVTVDTEYTCTGEVVAVGQSPRTEYMWFETGIDDASGKRIAEMRILLRWMKASSPLYPELRTE